MTIQSPRFDHLAARLRGLFEQPSPVTPDDREFDSLAREVFAAQFEHNEPLRRFCQSLGVTPEQTRTWQDIPAVPTAAFREFDFSCLPAARREFVFHSSGTTGPGRSRHFHDRESLALYEASLKPWFRQHLLADLAGPVPILFLCPPSHEAPHSSLAHMLATVRCEWGSPESVWGCRSHAPGTWSVDPAAAVAFLESASSGGSPVLVLGTAFSLVHLLEALSAMGRRFQLPDGSRLMETGGYKGRSRLVPEDELRRQITDRLGVPAEWIVCEYGMSELSSQAYDGNAGHVPGLTARAFRFPPWVRTRIVSPEDGREAAPGVPGLLHLHDLANLWSVASLQTEDLAVRREDGFVLIGRAPLTEPRGCSLMSP